jgi:hypothetical protein
LPPYDKYFFEAGAGYLSLSLDSLHTTRFPEEDREAKDAVARMVPTKFSSATSVPRRGCSAKHTWVGGQEATVRLRVS